MDFQYADILLIPLNMGVAEGLKLLGLNEKFAGLFAVICGLVEGITLFSDGDLAQGVLIGLAIGLSSVGLYSTGKNTTEALRG